MVPVLIFAGVIGLIFMVVKFAKAKAESDALMKRDAETAESNREKYRNAQKIYTRPRPSVDDAIDGL